ncbi:MAG TPA: hypothetical protein VJ654_02995 [Noviherbaspirillum sp.]|nr:hypothetical protein [Noviherbaspirillum sp.]
MAKHIKVLKHFNCYNPGELAMFDDDIADQIIDRKLGVEVKVDKSGKPVDDAKQEQK